jgi:choline dehydrogenase
MRSDDTTLFPDAAEIEIEDTTSGPNAPDLELFVSPVGYSDNGMADTPIEDSMGLHITLLRCCYLNFAWVKRY